MSDLAWRGVRQSILNAEQSATRQAQQSADRFAATGDPVERAMARYHEGQRWGLLMALSWVDQVLSGDPRAIADFERMAPKETP